MNPEAFKSAVTLGLTTGDWESFDQWVSTYSTFTFKDGADETDPVFDDAIVDFLVEILSDERFCSDQNSYKVLYEVERNWAVITEPQERRIFPALGPLFFASAEYMTRFVILELLGENYADEAAMNVLEQFAQVEDAEKRALVPMGFDDLIRETGDLTLARCAYENLKHMKGDAEEIVRYEARAYIARIEQRADELKFSYADLIAE